MNVITILKKYWWLIALILIFVFSYYIRSVNIVPDRVLGYDPVFQYRYTKYFVDWGFFPQWDELTYYVGRPINSTLLGSFMSYLTAILYWILKPFGMTLFTVCSYASAIYGAMMVIPAFLLGRELSNKYGGLLSAILVGTAPQILIRTFGSSYDTDQLALFFTLLTLYFGVYLLRKKDVKSFALATIGFTGFMLAWGLFIYSFIIIAAAVVLNLILATLFVGKDKIKEMEVKHKIGERFKNAFREFRKEFVLMVALFASIMGIGTFLKASPWISVVSIVGFASKAEAWIVNISIAELQKFSIFNLQGWMLATGRFMTGYNPLDIGVFMLFIGMIGFGIYGAWKKDIKKASFLLTLLVLGAYTSVRGVRFTEFTSILFIIMIGSGYGYFVEYFKKDDFLKIFSLGLGVVIIFVACGIGMTLGQQLGPDINPNWEDAWMFLKTQTPELSIVGTWWDPGHMIAGLAERRNFADGAHCPEPCMYNINDRIVDLGKIMATSDEDVAISLIKKYQGDSPKVYWIASDDLTSKFRWLQYFGTGCDGTGEYTTNGQNVCPLYTPIQRSDVKYSADNSVAMVYFQNIMIIPGSIPIPIYTDGKNGMLIGEVMFYNQEGEIKSTDLSSPEMVEAIRAFEPQINIKISDSAVPASVWMSKDYSYIVLIPANLRNAVFTKMFFTEGEGLEHFKQVFRNEQVKIYEVI